MLFTENFDSESLNSYSSAFPNTLLSIRCLASGSLSSGGVQKSIYRFINFLSSADGFCLTDMSVFSFVGSSSDELFH